MMREQKRMNEKVQKIINAEETGQDEEKEGKKSRNDNKWKESGKWSEE